MFPSSTRSMTSLILSIGASISIDPLIVMPRHCQCATLDDPLSSSMLCGAMARLVVAARPLRARRINPTASISILRIDLLNPVDDPAEGNLHVVAGLERSEHCDRWSNAEVGHLDRGFAGEQIAFLAIAFRGDNHVQVSRNAGDRELAFGLQYERFIGTFLRDRLCQLVADLGIGGRFH